MAKSKIPYESLSISDKIEVKRKKIQRLFRDLPAERKQFADGLIYQFAVTGISSPPTRTATAPIPPP